MSTPMTDEEVIRSFPPTSARPEAGYVTDFLGTRTRLSYLPNDNLPQTGLVEDLPIPTNFHATEKEWGGALRAALDAEENLTVIELGAGWGPWMVAVGKAAQLRGITDIRFVAVEADDIHYQWISDHFADNGFDPAQHIRILGIVGAEDGYAEFPIIEDPSKEWGAEAVFDEKPPLPPPQSPFQKLAALASRMMNKAPAFPSVPPEKVSSKMTKLESYEASPRKMKRVKSVSIKTILKEHRFVDLLHIDIQGAEADTISPALEPITLKVRRMVVGTHGRHIEERIFADMCAAGWILENEEPCQFTQHQGRMVLSRDGCQTWRNPRFDDAATRRRVKRAS